MSEHDERWMLEACEGLILLRRYVLADLRREAGADRNAASMGTDKTRDLETITKLVASCPVSFPDRSAPHQRGGV